MPNDETAKLRDGASTPGEVEETKQSSVPPKASITRTPEGRTVYRVPTPAGEVFLSVDIRPLLERMRAKQTPVALRVFGSEEVHENVDREVRTWQEIFDRRMPSFIADAIIGFVDETMLHHSFDHQIAKKYVDPSVAQEKYEALEQRAIERKRLRNGIQEKRRGRPTKWPLERVNAYADMYRKLYGGIDELKQLYEECGNDFKEFRRRVGDVWSDLPFFLLEHFKHEPPSQITHRYCAWLIDVEYYDGLTEILKRANKRKGSMDPQNEQEHKGNK